MRTLAPPDAECHVLTFREGLLSGLGHDLELAVTRFQIEIDEQARRGRASFDASSLRVVRALRDGAELPDGLSASDRAKIEQSTRSDVLDAERHPEIRFQATRADAVEGGYDIAGRLALHGAEREIVVPLRRDGDRYRAEVRLHQPDFGIRPYSALLGALKVQADVVVRVVLPVLAPS